MIHHRHESNFDLDSPTATTTIYTILEDICRYLCCLCMHFEVSKNRRIRFVEHIPMECLELPPRPEPQHPALSTQHPTPDTQPQARDMPNHLHESIYLS